MTPEDLIQETKDSIEFNTKKLEIIDKDIEEVKSEAIKKVENLQKERADRT